MEIQFASRMDGVKGSAIREIFKLLNQPDIISFAGGVPSPDTFPAEELKGISHRLLTENPGLYLQYGITEGYAPLIEIIEERLKAQNIVKSGDKNHYHQRRPAGAGPCRQGADQSRRRRCLRNSELCGRVKFLPHL